MPCRVLPWLLVALVAVSPLPAEELTWRRGLEPLTGASSPSDQLIVVAITSDAASRQQGEPARLWCEGMLQRRFDGLFERRPDLTEKLVFQAVPAGRPPILTGGETRKRPSRLVMAICDQRLRLLALAVGVPGTKALHDLMEDAEEARRIGTVGRTEVQEHVAARASERLPRIWAEATQTCLRTATAISLDHEPAGADALGAETRRQDSPLVDDPAKAKQQPLPIQQPPHAEGLGARLLVRRVLADLAPVYQQDVRLRFGITSDQDALRLATLEQHAETRRPWCEAILPALVDLDWKQCWQPVVASVWGRAPFRPQPLSDHLLRWAEWHAGRNAVVLELSGAPGHPADGWPRPVFAEDRAAANGLELQLAEQFQAMPYRTVSLEQLAGLIDKQGRPPIDVAQPSPARYVILEPGEEAPLVVRAGDSPAQWLRRIRRLRAARVRSSPP